MESTLPLLSLVIFFPLLGLVVVLLWPKERTAAIRVTALITSTATFLLSLAVLAGFDAGNPDLQLTV
ncbi:MAG: NADH-quinone oxidoreductase subunit M, partial [Anaerolineales bacterium]